MASIFKRKPGGPYYVAYYPRPHDRKIVCGCADYKATEALARKLETDAMMRRKGVIDSKAEKLSHSEARPLAEHLAEFITALRGKGGTAKHVQRTERFIQAVAKVCEFKRLVDIDASKVSAHVADLRAKGMSARAINAKLTAAK